MARAELQTPRAALATARPVLGQARVTLAGARAELTGGGEPGPFDPLTAFGGVHLWLDADTGLYSDTGMTTPAGADGAVAAWADQSGNGFHFTQATAGNRPRRRVGVANGHDAVDGDGTDDFLAAATLDLSEEASVFAVVLPQGTTGTRALFGHDGWLFVGQAAGQFRTGWGQGWYDPAPSDHGALAVGEWAMLGAVKDYVNGYAYLDGIRTDFYATPASGWTNAGQLLGIDGGNAWNGYLAELLVWDTHLTPAQIVLVHDYLSAKYGIAYGDPLAPPADETVRQATATAIRAEVTRANSDAGGRPLPVAASWNVGEYVAWSGYDPDWQLQQIGAGHHLLPSFQWPPTDTNDSHMDPGYYTAALFECARLDLPVVFQSTQWEAPFGTPVEQGGQYLGRPIATNPNTFTLGGSPNVQSDPLGPTAPWTEVAGLWDDGPKFPLVQEWHPSPPRLFLLSNNEHPRLQWYETETSKRWVDTHGTGQSAAFRQTGVFDGHVTRFGLLMDAIKGIWSAGWQAAAATIGYEAFGPNFFGTANWANYAYGKPNEISMWPHIFDGGSPSYYLWAPAGDYPEANDFEAGGQQVAAMNWVWMKDAAEAVNPAFWFELSVWDGQYPGNPTDDKKAWYESIGQTLTPERYGGFVRFGMWLLLPRCVRDYRDSNIDRAAYDHDSYYNAVIAAVDEVHTDATLTQFWRSSTLVEHPTEGHPFDTEVPAGWADEPRWFLLDCDANPARPWADLTTTTLNVFALARVRGTTPNREWLVYAQAPIAAETGAVITVPGFRAITVDVARAGSFYLCDEAADTVTEVTP